MLSELKRTPVVVGDLLWRPFENRFQDILERMSFHQMVLKDELNLASMKALQSTLNVEYGRADDARLEARRHAELLEDIRRAMAEDSQRELPMWNTKIFL
jgi:hypothetical protein